MLLHITEREDGEFEYSVKSVGFSKYNNKSVVDVIHQYKGILQNGYCLNFMQVDLTYV